MNAILTRIAATVCLILTITTAACGSGNGTESAPIPRRHAYPRLNIYDAEYVTATVDNVLFSVNANARITRPDSLPNSRGSWFNITYPGYDAVIHCTVTTALTTEIETIIDNRAERMALNTGGAYTEVTDFIPQSEQGFTAQMLVTPAESVTPVQFLASDGIHTVVSGSMTFRTAGRIDPDSVAPVISAIRADITELLNTLSTK